tara:strand:+ start:2475 stop:2753 length:279 start_codon:yes stop_codon:yes gene_type:complete
MAIYTKNRKKRIVREVAEMFAKNKSVPENTTDFMKLTRPLGITAVVIRAAFGNWGKFINAIKLQEKQLWDEATAVKSQPQVKTKVKKNGKDI